MARAGLPTTGQKRAGSIVRLAIAVVVAGPLIVFLGVIGTRLGIWDWRFGHDVLAQQWAWWAALGGGGAALVAVIAALVDIRRLWPWALAAVVVSAATLFMFVQRMPAASEASSPPDATTNIADRPIFSRRILAQRAAAGAVSTDRWIGTTSSCALESLPTQVAPEAAGWALEQAGFTVLGFGVGRADGVREGVWFGFTHDATVRIRPGQTDVRVTGREDRLDDGEACRLAGEILAALQTGR